MSRFGILFIYLSILVSVFFQKDSMYNILGYSCILVALVLLFFDNIIYKRKMNNFVSRIAIFLSFSIIIVQLISSFKFGINNIFSMFSAYLIVLFIIIYMFINNKFIYLIRNIVILWSFLEVIAIVIYLYNYGFNMNFIDSLIIRKIIPVWPNYFAMISAIKMGLYYKVKNLNRISIFPSIIVIILAQSRTALLMGFVIIVFNIMLGKKIGEIKRIFLIAFIICSVIVGWYSILGSKGRMENNSIEHTMESRQARWILLNKIIKENRLVGIGFRSTTTITKSETGIEIGSSHNDYIDNILRGGIIYFIIFYGLVVLSIVYASKNKKYSNISILLSVLLAGFTQNPLKNLIIQMIFIFILIDSFYRLNNEVIS